MAGGAPTTANDTWHQWAYGVLNGIGAPITQTNLQTLWNWSLKESGQSVMRWNNPLNTTQPAPGASSQNSVGVKSYPTVDGGTQATVQTLTNGRYPAIVGALKQSVPTAQWTKDSAIVNQLNTWSGNKTGSYENWLHWTNKPPPWVNSSLQSSGGSNVLGNLTKGIGAGISGSGLPKVDPLAGIAGAITGAEKSFVGTLTNITLMAMGGLLMLGGLALIAFAALKVAPAPVRQVAEGVSNLTPQGRAVSVARAVTPKPAAVAPTAPAAKPALSPQAQSSVAAARAGRGSKLSPGVKTELRRAS